MPSVNGRRVWVGAVAIATLLLLLPGPLDASASPTAFQTTRTFHLGAGRATRTFTFRERSGMILLNRLTVPYGVRAFVDARIPHLAGARVSSWPSRNDPSLACQRKGGFDICTQEEEWCPMPRATWHLHLVKLTGRSGPIRFDYVVAAPPSQR